MPSAMPKLPELFIGSSVEQLDTARAIKQSLDPYDANVTIWNEGVFNLNHSTLDDLMAAAAKFDFAIFVFAPDDITKFRKSDLPTVRDNVLFELGLFMGGLGKQRCFWVMPTGAAAPHIPTDLRGITTATFVPRDNPIAAVGNACDLIRREIKKLGHRTDTQMDELESPRILCAASPNHAQLGFDGDIEALKTAFPNSPITVEAAATGSTMRQLLAKNAYDIIHIVSHVDKETGDLVFDQACDPQGSLKIRPTDVVPATGVAALVEQQPARLVVFATCNSTLLAHQLRPLTNVVAGVNNLVGDEATEWANLFYSTLASGRPLLASFDLSQKATGVALALFFKRDFKIAQ